MSPPAVVVDLAQRLRLGSEDHASTVTPFQNAK
jgi:hypothetical protein